MRDSAGGARVRVDGVLGAKDGAVEAYRDVFTACPGSPCPSQAPQLSFNADRLTEWAAFPPVSDLTLG